MRRRFSIGLLVFLAVASAVRVMADDLVVTDNSDTGTGTLRWAIETANSKPEKGNRIRFALPSQGSNVIGLEAPLPAITGRLAIVAEPGEAELNGRGWTGTGLRFAPGSAGSEVRGLVVRGFGDFAGPLAGIGVTIEADSVALVDCSLVDNSTCGVWVAGVWARIENNRVGLDAKGSCAGNGVGIIVSTPGIGATIRGNEIGCGRGAGILLLGVSGARVHGNWVGTDRSGSAGKGNGGSGISCQGWRDPLTGLWNGAGAALIGGEESGAGNTISHNGGYGVEIGDADEDPSEASDAPRGIRITRNRIVANHEVAKEDLRPVGIRRWVHDSPLMDAAAVKASKEALSGHAAAGDLVEVYESDAGGFDVGEYVGSARADEHGVWILRGVRAKPQTVYVASATGADNSTSEFASQRGAPAPPPAPKPLPKQPVIAAGPLAAAPLVEAAPAPTRETTPAPRPVTVEEYFLLRLVGRGVIAAGGSLRSPLPPRPVAGPVPLGHAETGGAWRLERAEIVADREHRFEGRIETEGGTSYGMNGLREKGAPPTAIREEFAALYQPRGGAFRAEDLVELIMVEAGSSSELPAGGYLLKAVWRSQ